MAGLSTGAPIVQVYHEKSMILPDVSRVLACLYEKDVKFETHTASYKSLLRLQASTHAPVPFYDGPTFLEESREICRYIAETYEHQGYPFLLGNNGLERASIEQWLHHEEHDFNPPSRSLFCHLAFPLDDEDEDDEINLQKRKLEEVLEVYDQRLSDSEFLAGNNFTLADLVHLPNSHYITASDKFVYLYDSRKNVQRWWNAISSRDSWQKVLRYIKQVEQRSKLEEIQKQQQQQFAAETPREDTSVSAADQTKTAQTIFSQQPTPPAPITREVPDAQHVMMKPQEGTPDIPATDSAMPPAPSQQQVSHAPPTIPGQEDMTPAPPAIPAQATYPEAPRDSASTQDVPSDALRKTELAEPTSIDQEVKEPTAGPASASIPQHADTLGAEAAHAEQEFVPSDQESVSAAQQFDSAMPPAPSQQQVSHAPPTIPGQKDMTPAPPTIPAQATYPVAPRDSATEESRKQQQAEQAVFQSTQGSKKQVEETEAQDTGTNEPEETNLHENTNQKNNETSQWEALDQSGKQASGVQLLSKNTNNGSESTKDAPSGFQTDHKYENSLRTSEESKQQIQTEGKIHGGETEQPAYKTEQPKERDLPANSGRSINSQSQAEASDESKEQSSSSIQNKNKNSSKLHGSTNDTKSGDIEHNP